MARQLSRPSKSATSGKHIHPLVAIGIIVGVLIIAAICVSIPYRSTAQAGRDATASYEQGTQREYDALSGRGH